MPSQPSLADISQKLKIPEKFLRVLVSGWGDQMAIGVLFHLLKPQYADKKLVSGVDAERLHELLLANKPLLENVSDGEWQSWRDLARAAHLQDLTTARIIEAFRKHRTDLLGTVVNTPGGEDWLKRQADILRTKLGLAS